jgi:hypothetical protein
VSFGVCFIQFHTRPISVSSVCHTGLDSKVKGVLSSLSTAFWAEGIQFMCQSLYEWFMVFSSAVTTKFLYHRLLLWVSELRSKYRLTAGLSRNYLVLKTIIEKTYLMTCPSCYFEVCFFSNRGTHIAPVKPTVCVCRHIIVLGFRTTDFRRETDID